MDMRVGRAFWMKTMNNNYRNKNYKNKNNVFIESLSH